MEDKKPHAIDIVASGQMNVTSAPEGKRDVEELFTMLFKGTFSGLVLPKLEVTVSRLNVDSDGQPFTVRNFYGHCDEKWNEDWTCGCNSECPSCGTKDITPIHTVDLDATDDAWEAKYKPITNPIEERSWNGKMFETFGLELEVVKAAAARTPSKVWTLCESDGTTFITHGFHFVNRLGYFITENSVEPAEEFVSFISDVEPELDDTLEEEFA